MTKEKTIR